MAVGTKTMTGYYIYAIAKLDHRRALRTSGIGEASVETIGRGTVAVVSRVHGRLRPERKNLRAHQTVLRACLEGADAVLPCAFGFLAEDRASVEEFMEEHRNVIEREIRRVRGRVEMGMRIAFDVQNVFEFFVKSYADLAAARDRVFGGDEEATAEEKIELGRLFEMHLRTDREEYGNRVEQILTPVCAEVVRLPARVESEAARLACLVDKRKMEDFEAKVFEAARRFDNNFAIDYNGPWAPHNFVDLSFDGSEED